MNTIQFKKCISCWYLKRLLHLCICWMNSIVARMMQINLYTLIKPIITNSVLQSFLCTFSKVQIKEDVIDYVKNIILPPKESIFGITQHDTISYLRITLKSQWECLKRMLSMISCTHVAIQQMYRTVLNNFTASNCQG